jgi:hypothetical protein
MSENTVFPVLDGAGAQGAELHVEKAGNTATKPCCKRSWGIFEWCEKYGTSSLELF